MRARDVSDLMSWPRRTWPYHGDCISMPANFSQCMHELSKFEAQKRVTVAALQRSAAIR